MTRVIAGVVLVSALAAGAGCGGTPKGGEASAGGDRERSVAVRKLILAIDQGEVCNRKFYGRYTDSIADLELMVGGKVTDAASQLGLDVQLDAGTTGASFIVRLRSRGVDTYYSRRGTDFVDYGDSGVFSDKPPNTCARSHPSPYRPAK